MKGHQGQFLKQSDNNITFTFTIMVPHCDWIYSPLSSVASQPCSLIDQTLNWKHRMEISCVQCNLSFKMTKDLKTHMLQHEGKKFHSCSQCKYSTIGASHLKCHMRVHSGEKPFACKQCNFACTQASNLKSHMLTHSGEKSFICTQCDYSCTTTGILKRHMLTHLEEKPFQLYSVWLLFHNGWYT